MDVERPYTVKEAAKVSGMSEGWWRQKIFHRAVRHLKVGKKVLIPRETIRQLFNGSVVEPLNEKNV